MSKSKSHRNKSHRNKSQSDYKGGNNLNIPPNFTSAGSASNFGVQAYGNIGDQIAKPGTNLIDVKNLSNGVFGGRRRRRSKSCKKTRKHKK